MNCTSFYSPAISPYSGSQAEFVSAYDELLEPLCRSTGVESQQIYAVPGNHDMDRGEAKWVGQELVDAVVDERGYDLLTQGPRQQQLVIPFKAFADLVKRHS